MESFNHLLKSTLSRAVLKEDEKLFWSFKLNTWQSQLVKNIVQNQLCTVVSAFTSQKWNAYHNWVMQMYFVIWRSGRISSACINQSGSIAIIELMLIYTI